MELLVVIGIIAALIALLMPAYVKARRKSQQVVCISNMRQISIHLFTYIDRMNRGAFPRLTSAGTNDDDGWVDTFSASWLYASSPGVIPSTVRLLGADVPGRLLYCPSDPLNRFNWWRFPFSYPINAFLSSHPISRIKNTSGLIMMIDLAAPWGQAPGVWYSDATRMAHPWPTVLSILHDKSDESLKFKQDFLTQDSLDVGLGNVLFVDGHCDFVARRFSVDPKNSLVVLR